MNKFEKFCLGDIVATEYGEGIVIDVTDHNEIQIAFDDGRNIYWQQDEVVELNKEDHQAYVRTHYDFYKNICKMLWDRVKDQIITN